MTARADGMAGVLKMPLDRPFRILQLTDLHLMGIADDERTFGLIRDLSAFTRPDLVFFTGDQTMADDSEKLYRLLAARMAALGVPWTFVFGNHDAEGAVARADLVAAVRNARGLLFAARRGADGDSDFYLEIAGRDDVPAWLLFGLDTHIDATYDLPQGKTWGYGAIMPEQTAWFERIVAETVKRAGRIIPNAVFQHIPPLSAQRYDERGGTVAGERNENVSAPPVDFGQAEALVRNRSTRAVFYGHDHLDDYAFVEDGILFAFGRVSGHYDYAMPGFPKGGRVVDLHDDGTVTTSVLLHRDVPRR